MIRQMLPKDGEIVNVQGHPMIVSGVRTYEKENGEVVYRFTGTCTEDPINDQIRHTSYNGGTYGGTVRRNDSHERD